MADTSQSERAAESSPLAHQQSPAAHGGKHTHHGRTPAAWTGVAFNMVGFTLGGFAVVAQNWVLFTIAVIICALGLVATVVLRQRGYGAS